MNININIDNKIIKKSQLKNLPDFIVITGENGSGKTQFLNLLANRMEPLGEAYPPQWNETDNKEVYVSDIVVNNLRLTRINYVPVYEHYIDLGQEINPNVLNNNWGKLPIKYYSFLSLKRLNGQSRVSRQALLNQYKNDINISSSNSNNHDYLISESVVNLFEKIYENKVNKLDPTTIQECIINVPIQAGNLFSANLSLLYLQYYCKLELGHNIKESPWVVFNEILEEANFKYRLQELKYSPNNYNIKIQLVDIYNNNIVDIHSLSSGERTIMSLILALYNSDNIEFPEAILFDEPDSSLHPSMSKQMLDVLQNVFVKKKNCKVIITTHSPTTVALSPDLSIYRMDRNVGTLKKETKENAIKSLNKGLENISIYFENRKQIFVESSIDKNFYEFSYNNLKRKNYLNEKISLEFVTTAEKKDKGESSGGCTFVKEFIKKLSNNKSIFGLIDYDNANFPSEKISILGQQKRYSIENYILDPIYLTAFILSNEDKEKANLGFQQDDYIIDFTNYTSDKIQEHINELVNKYKLFNSESKLEYSNIKGDKYLIPESWFKMKGHKLEDEIFNKVPFLRKYAKNGLSNEILDIVKMFPELLPTEILETYKEIENK